MRDSDRALPARSPGRRAASLALLLAGLLAAAAAGCGTAPAHHLALTVACSTRVPPAPPGTGQSPQSVAVPGDPWAAVALPGSGQVVASLTTSGPLGTRGELAVLASDRGRYRMARTVSLPRSVGGASGMTVSPDGRLLLVAGQSATAVVSTARLHRGGAIRLSVCSAIPGRASPRSRYPATAGTCSSAMRHPAS